MRAALILTGSGPDRREHLVDVPSGLERLVPSGVPGVVLDRPYAATGVLACWTATREIVELWEPLPLGAILTP